MILYRYLREEFALQAIQKGELKVGRLGDLNDPADCLPMLSNAPVQGEDAEREAFERRYFTQIHNDIGILSFSATVTDPVIWSHYADAHHGMALGYDFGAHSAKLVEVVYNDSRVVLDYNELEKSRGVTPDNGKFIENVLTKGFSSKALSWKYESEYRLFVNLWYCRMNGPHYFLNIMRPCKVILGLKCRITESDVSRMAPSPSPVVTRARMGRERHALVVD